MGERGGQDAADELLMAVKHYLKKESSVPGLGGVEVLVRAFANVSGLGAALQRNGRLGDAQQLRAFTAGFSNRNAFFDFVDIGPGKERADLKIRGTYVEAFASSLPPPLDDSRPLTFFLLYHREHQVLSQQFPV